MCRLPDSSSLTTINLQTLLEKYFKVQSLSLMLIIFQPTLFHKHLQYSKFKTVKRKKFKTVFNGTGCPKGCVGKGGGGS